MRSTGCGAGAVEQARGAALGRRVLGDQFGRQLEVEIAEGERRLGVGGQVMQACGPAPEVDRRSKAELFHARQVARRDDRSGGAVPAARRARRKGAGEARPACATSTWRCTCRCATRTRRASCAIADARDGDTVQVEGTVRDGARSSSARAASWWCGGRRQRRAACCASCNFYPSQQKALAVGTRVRVRGEVRGGFLGREMVHPAFKAVDGGTPLPTALTPVYPTVRQLPQAYLRKAVAAALARAPLAELLPPDARAARAADAARGAAAFCTTRRPTLALAALEDHSHPAWQRLKAEELLAQQLVAAAGHARARAAARAGAALRAGGGLHEQLLAALPFALTAAQRRVGAEIAPTWRARVPMHRLLQGDVGSGKTVVAALAAGRRHRRRLAVRADGADRDPGRAALPQAGRLAGAAGRAAWPGSPAAARARRARRCWRRSTSARPALVVGTHAVIQEQVQFAQPRPGHHRRAAPLRRRAAAGAARQARSAGARASHC